MTIAPLELLKFSKEVIRSNTETAYRAAVSRSYYSCYHYSMPMADLLDAGNEIGTHEKHLNKFINATNMKTKAIGYLMKQCRARRTDADYNLSMTFTKEMALEAIQSVERVIDKIDELSD